MDSQSSGAISPGAAKDQLRSARLAHDASLRRAIAPAGFILALSAFCGAQTVAPADKGPGNVVTIIAVVWFVAELVRLSARHGWRPLRSLPQPRWDVAEVVLIAVAVLVGGVVGPHLLASPRNAALVSWGLGVGVALTVAGCLFAATTSYRRRAARTWPR